MKKYENAIFSKRYVFILLKFITQDKTMHTLFGFISHKKKSYTAKAKVSGSPKNENKIIMEKKYSLRNFTNLQKILTE